jgi:lysophospholipid acyltransferase (LPLAT)-like uncharacterized protein
MNAPGPDLRNTIYKRATLSGRRMTRLRRLSYRLIVPLGIAIVHLWWRMCRVVRIEGAEHLTAALAAAPSLIPCYWHQHLLYCSWYLLRQRERGLKVGWLISPSVDGELGAMLVTQVGGYAIRGSSTHTGARALRDYYEALVKQGISTSITPDGPRGPRNKFKPGAVLLSQMSGRPIVPLAYAASHAWRIKWDHFVVPWPFARIAIAIGAPRQVPRGMDAQAVQRWQDEMEQELRQLFKRARAALG